MKKILLTGLVVVTVLGLAGCRSNTTQEIPVATPTSEPTATSTPKPTEVPKKAEFEALPQKNSGVGPIYVEGVYLENTELLELEVDGKTVYYRVLNIEELTGDNVSEDVQERMESTGEKLLYCEFKRKVLFGNEGEIRTFSKCAAFYVSGGTDEEIKKFVEEQAKISNAEDEAAFAKGFCTNEFNIYDHNVGYVRLEYDEVYFVDRYEDAGMVKVKDEYCSVRIGVSSKEEWDNPAEYYKAGEYADYKLLSLEEFRKLNSYGQQKERVYTEAVSAEINGREVKSYYSYEDCSKISYIMLVKYSDEVYLVFHFKLESPDESISAEMLEAFLNYK